MSNHRHAALIAVVSRSRCLVFPPLSSRRIVVVLVGFKVASRIFDHTGESFSSLPLPHVLGARIRNSATRTPGSLGLNRDWSPILRQSNSALTSVGCAVR
ncbi:hypothetical protein CC2G_003665 [Coprinopsis cinerea AmutBmut pab1-1]|nr:hypothetical protein CC2G_003665 [Coprinopsis cinerea AmutBmut pab1-1]